MISGTPSPFARSLSGERPIGLEAFLDRHARESVRYGSGKAALADGLSGLVDPGANALLPAYLPDAVVEPFRELGLEVRHYAIEPGLAPDLADLERRTDAATTAVVTVDYFGFPQPGLEEFVALREESDWYHVDDAAHAPFSVVEGTLLGTRGHLGIASLRKHLPIPNGAVLYCTDDAVLDALAPSPYAGVRERVDASDCRFLLTSVLFDAVETVPAVRRAMDAIVPGWNRPTTVPSPKRRYEAGKRPMSALSAHLLESLDPGAIRTARRRNYRTWLEVLGTRADVDPVFETLPEGVCPQVFPVRASDPGAFLRELDRCGVDGAHNWPRLSRSVRGDSRYETANRLAAEVVVLPVHQDLEPSAIASLRDRLG